MHGCVKTDLQNRDLTRVAVCELEQMGRVRPNMQCVKGRVVCEEVAQCANRWVELCMRKGTRCCVRGSQTPCVKEPEKQRKPKASGVHDKIRHRAQGKQSEPASRVRLHEPEKGAAGTRGHVRGSNGNN